MANAWPVVYLARHGETAWSATGQHTGLTDLPLTPEGEAQAELLRMRLAAVDVAHVLTSPLARARRTCEIAGFGAVAQLDDDLVEWNYGEYEGVRTADILLQRPGWKLFRDGCPGGEMAADVGARADRVLARVRALPGNVLLFSSGHILRTLAARWLGRPPEAGALLVLGTASLSSLSYEHGMDEPVIRTWNERGALAKAPGNT